MSKFHRQRFRQRNLYLVPAQYILAAIVLGLAIPHIHRIFFPWVTAPIRKDVAIAFLSSASTGMMALTGITFSIGIVIITFSNTAYSPRLVHAYSGRTLLHAIGLFTGTFIFMLLAMREIGQQGITTVNGLIIWISLAWIVASSYMLIRLIMRTWMMTVSVVLATIVDNGLRSIQCVYPAPYASSTPRDAPAACTSPPSQVVRYHGHPLHIHEYDTAELVALAQRADGVIHLPYIVGNTLIEGDAFALVYGRGRIAEERVRRAVHVGVSRSIDTDPMYAIRLLVDIGIRALSPAVNDPTTAVESIDGIEALLRQLGHTDLAIGQVCDDAGVVRLVYTVPTWEDYLLLGIQELLYYGADSVQTQRRLGMLLQHVHDSVPEPRRAAVARLITYRQAVVTASFPDATERAVAQEHDRSGLGHTRMAGDSPHCP